MKLMRELDPRGVQQRKSRKLKRRTYNSLVRCFFICMLAMHTCLFRDQIIFGMWMDTINLAHMDLAFMAALMGMYFNMVLPGCDTFILGCT